MIASTGPLSALTTVPIAPTDSVVPNNANLNFPNKDIAVDIGPASVPITTNNGPIAATTVPMITMVLVI